MIGRFIVFSLIFLFIQPIYSFDQKGEKAISESKIKVAIRLLGHHVLLLSGDTSSRILPVEKELNRYKLSFEHSFELNPNKLVSLVDSIFRKAEMSPYYIVELEDCTSKKVMYSFEMKEKTEEGLIPCGSRLLPHGCYTFFVTFMPKNELRFIFLDPLNHGETALETDQKPSIFAKLNFVFLLPVLFVGFLFFAFKSGRPKLDEHQIKVGSFLYDTINMTLTNSLGKVELSSKESALLTFLYENANKTVGRDQILREIWGDEGDYIGRTLDVFISKLRKKLEPDTNLKILNIRGIGYKLIKNDA
ncbi:MAG: winged helix-turn-helix domain-containing protein [Saprospiraceae bacterium]